MSNNDKANGYNALKVSKFDHSSNTPRALAGMGGQAEVRLRVNLPPLG
jgi:hypothetical protein